MHRDAHSRDMSDDRLPIHDPEVRQQHRRQLRADMLRVARRAFTVAAVFFMIFAGIKVFNQLGPRVPATVVAVDTAKSSVTVASPYPDASGSYTVNDTDAYDVGDEVGVVRTGEDDEPTFLDREPLAEPLLAMAGLLAALAAVGMSPRLGILWRRARRRRRALTRPWRHAHVQVTGPGLMRLAAGSADDAETWWRLRDLPVDFPDAASVGAQLAGTARTLVVRFSGSPHLVTGRRLRQPTGESAMSAPRCTSVGVSDPRSSSSCLARRK